jgi:hypothetical protein
MNYCQIACSNNLPYMASLVEEEARLIESQQLEKSNNSVLIVEVSPVDKKDREEDQLLPLARAIAKSMLNI